MILKDKRVEVGITQAELADRLGVKQNTVSSWESGKSYPRMDMIFKLSELFNCPVSELVEGWRDG